MTCVSPSSRSKERGAWSLELDESAANRFRYGVRAVDGAELGEDDLETLLDRDLAAAEGDADLAIGRALTCSAENFAVLVAEVGVAPGLLARETGEIAQHAVKQLGAELAAAAGGVAD